MKIVNHAFVIYYGIKDFKDIANTYSWLYYIIT